MSTSVFSVFSVISVISVVQGLVLVRFEFLKLLYLLPPISLWIPLERRADRRGEMLHHRGVDVGDQINVVDTEMIGIVHVVLVFVTRRESPAAVPLSIGLLT